jgi:hypothetical protein
MISILAFCPVALSVCITKAELANVIKRDSPQEADVIQVPVGSYLVHKSTPPVYRNILSHINAGHNSHPILLISILILSYHLHLRLPISLFPSELEQNRSKIFTLRH